MSLADPSKQERTEELLRKSLFGEELINTQFHLFSARSTPSGRIVKPRVLCANNVLLAKSSKYFLDLLSSDINPSDSSLSDLTDDNDMPNNVRIDEYGYASDSDLDDDDEEPSNPVVDTEAPKDQPAMISASPPHIRVTTQLKDDDELSEDGTESVSSDMFVMSPEHSRMDEPFVVNVDGARSVASSETAVQETVGNKTSVNPSGNAMRLRSLGSRHVLVKDTAFQTWYTLLNYLYTGKFKFLPLSSAAPGGQSYVSSTSPLDEPKCSAKSMYRLACKVGLDHLRDEAFAHIQQNLSEHNILKELSCNLVSRHPELLEMELDVLYAQIASPTVVTGFPALAQRIALKELPHGADIIVGIHARLLKERQSLPSTPTPAFAPSPLESSIHLSPSVPLVDPPPAVCEVASEPMETKSRPFSFADSPPAVRAQDQGKPIEAKFRIFSFADSPPAVQAQDQGEPIEGKSKPSAPPFRGSLFGPWGEVSESRGSGGGKKKKK